MVRLFAIGIVFGFSTVLYAGDEVSKSVPSFQVSSGDDQVLTDKDLFGKVTILFYETRDVVELNQQLKDRLRQFVNELPDSQRARIMRVPVINAQTANVFSKPFWKSRFREKSQENAVTVYGDWQGALLHDFGLQDEDSNLLIIDQQGGVRLSLHGKIDGEQQFADISRLISQLASN